MRLEHDTLRQTQRLLRLLQRVCEEPAGHELWRGEDPAWAASFVSRLRFDAAFREQARKAFLLLMPRTCRNPDPTRETEHSLSYDELEQLADAPELWSRLRADAASQLRYLEGLAWSALHETRAEREAELAAMAETRSQVAEAAVTGPRRLVGFELVIQAGRGGLHLPAGLCPVGEREALEPRREAVLWAGDLTGTRIELDDRARELRFSGLPMRLRAGRLRLTVGQSVLEAVRAAEGQWVFDLDPVWSAGRLPVRLELAESAG